MTGWEKKVRKSAAEQGRLIKAYNSFFYVQLDDADSAANTTESAEGSEGLLPCKLRGKLKRARRSLAVVPGDRVQVSRLPDGSGVIEEVLPRENLLQRPAVANLTQVMLTFAAAQPDPHPLLLNRFLVLAEWSEIPRIAICVNKMDLRPDEPDFLAAYEAVGYPVYRVSAKENAGLDALKEALEGQTTVFAGPSGVGKSSLLNAIDSGLQLQTSHISAKIKRGRHTTRVAELIPWQGGYIVDTPGFSAMELTAIDPQQLPLYFPDFRPYLGACRFQPCSHSHEPDCAIKQAVEEGKIQQERYDAYLTLYQEIEEERKKEYR